MKRIGLYLFIIGITFIKAYGQEDSGPVNTGAANYLTIPVDARSAAMGGAGVAISRGNNAVSHNGAATLSEAMQDRKSTRLNSSHSRASRMPSSA